MCLITLSTTSARNNVTVHPPNPPPVILLPKTPSICIANSTNRSSSGQETSKSSFKDLWLSSINLPKGMYFDLCNSRAASSVLFISVITCRALFSRLVLAFNVNLLFIRFLKSSRSASLKLFLPNISAALWHSFRLSSYSLPISTKKIISRDIHYNFYR